MTVIEHAQNLKGKGKLDLSKSADATLLLCAFISNLTDEVMKLRQVYEETTDYYFDDDWEVVRDKGKGAA